MRIEVWVVFAGIAVLLSCGHPLGSLHRWPVAINAERSLTEPFDFRALDQPLPRRQGRG